MKRFDQKEHERNDEPLWPNLAGLELAPTTANKGEVKKWRAADSVAMVSSSRQVVLSRRVDANVCVIELAGLVQSMLFNGRVAIISSQHEAS